MSAVDKNRSLTLGASKRKQYNTGRGQPGIMKKEF